MPARPGCDYAGFSTVSDGSEPRALVVEPEDPEWKGDPRWDSNALFRGDWDPPRPLRFKRAEGSIPLDFVQTTLFVPYLVSDRVVEALSDLSGWRTFAVDFEGYHGLSITGRSGPPVDEWSEEVTIPPRAPGGRPGRRLKGLYFDPDEWDGSDVFVPDGTAFVIVRGAVADALRKIGATNVLLTPLPELELPLLRSRA